MKNFKYIALASVLALGMSSCGDFGDTNIPTTSTLSLLSTIPTVRDLN
jgi:hypothetical protein